MFELARDQPIASKAACVRHHGLPVGTVNLRVTGRAGLTSRFGVCARLRRSLDGHYDGKKQVREQSLGTHCSCDSIRSDPSADRFLDHQAGRAVLVAKTVRYLPIISEIRRLHSESLFRAF